MSDAAVIFDGVWKKFRRGERHDSLRDLVPSVARHILRPARPDQLDAEEFWALKDVSFEVKQGEALGIIGPNGAGKSTVLKLLTKILKPTRGRCEVRGRLGALIEVGAGFHPDLTGRENIFLQGAIMGMRRAEIARKLEAIVEFAGVRESIDTPVKRYSSGMNARLGFSIAAHLDPEALIVDEVLSVGDMGFQERCLTRMREFKRNGVAMVFVSHDLQAVASLCDEALYLRGSPRGRGAAQSVIAKYIEDTLGARQPAGGLGPIDIVSAQLLDSEGRKASMVTAGTPLILRVEHVVRRDVTGLTLSLVLFRSNDSFPVYSGNFTQVNSRQLATGDTLIVEYALQAHVRRGQYHFACTAFHNPTLTEVARLSPAAMLTVDESQMNGGIANLNATCRILEEAHPGPALRHS